MTSPRRKRIKWRKWNKRRSDKIAKVATAVANHIWKEREESFVQAYSAYLVTGRFEYDITSPRTERHE